MSPDCLLTTRFLCSPSLHAAPHGFVYSYMKDCHTHLEWVSSPQLLINSIPYRHSHRASWSKKILTGEWFPIQHYPGPSLNFKLTSIHILDILLIHIPIVQGQWYIAEISTFTAWGRKILPGLNEVLTENLQIVYRFYITVHNNNMTLVCIWLKSM